MLSNAYFHAKFRFDTAENEPAKNLQKISENSIFVKWSFSKCIEDVEIGWKASPLLRQSTLHSLNRAKGRKPKTQPYTDYWLARPAALFPPLPSCPAFFDFSGLFQMSFATERKMSRSRSVLSIFSNEFILVYFQ